MSISDYRVTKLTLGLFKAYLKTERIEKINDTDHELDLFWRRERPDFFSFVAMTLNFRIFLRTKCTWLETEMEKARFQCTNDTCSLFH